MNNIKEITPELTEIKTGTPGFKIGSQFFVGGIGGNSIPGITGTDVRDTTAVASDVLSGKVFHLANGTSVTGTITSKSAQTYTPGTTNQTISAGQYLSGTQTISGDVNLTAANIANGVTIFGVTGTHQGGTDVSDTTAVASDVLSGKVFHLANGTSVTGTITSKSAQTYTPGTTNQTISAGQYLTGAQTISGDANLTAANIANGVTIFGVTGTHQGGTNGIIFNGPAASATSVQVIPTTFTSGFTNFSNMFSYCTSLITVPQFDTSSGTKFNHMFFCCYALTTVPQFDTSNGTDLNYMFGYCQSLTTVPQLDTSNGTNFSYMFSLCSSLTTFGGLLNCKKSYDLSACTLLTHESLMNAINGLYNLTGQTGQTLTLGATNIGKLTSAEIAIATNKNWTLA